MISRITEITCDGPDCTQKLRVSLRGPKGTAVDKAKELGWSRSPSRGDFCPGCVKRDVVGQALRATTTRAVA